MFAGPWKTARMKLLKPKNRKIAIPLETERFVLEPMGYFQTLRVTNCWRRDPEILTAFYQSPKPRSLRKWMRSGLLPNNQTRFAFAIIPKGTDQPIGVEIVWLSGYRSASNMIALHKHKWRGKGVVFEIRAKIINHIFRSGDVDRFFSTVEGRNAASIFNYKRLGFNHVGTWHRHCRNPITGDVSDLVCFELLKENWDEGPWAE